MEDVHVSSAEKPARRPPWNKGKLTGPKPPLRPGHVWSIRAKLQTGAIVSATWRCSTSPSTASCAAAIWLRCPRRRRGAQRLRTSIARPSARSKTGRPVRFELTE